MAHNSLRKASLESMEAEIESLLKTWKPQARCLGRIAENHEGAAQQCRKRPQALAQPAQRCL
jgi:hypothetical protein